jgi:hypothetical protein
MTPPEATEEGLGCRAVSITALALVAIAAVLWTAGYLLVRPDSCTGVCEWVGFTLMFGGAPVSGVFTALGGQDLVLAWPVDVLVWFLAAALHTRLSQEARPWSPRWNRLTLMFVVLALGLGSLLALGVERVR